MASAKKTPAKPAAAKAPAKAAAPKAAPKAPAKPPAPGLAPKAPAAKPAPEGDSPVKLPKAAGAFPQQLAQIEIVKEGHFFIARTVTDSGQKEYKNTVFEDLLTEMLITLQEQLAD